MTDPSGQELAASSVVAQANSNAASSGAAIGTTLAQTAPMTAKKSMKLMMSMKAKMYWVPYARKLRKRKLRQNIDYNLLEYKIKWITDAIGYY